MKYREIYRYVCTMRCESLLTMLLVNTMLVSATGTYKRDIDPREKPGGVVCKPNRKSSQMASKAAIDAKTAKDAQPCAADAAGVRAMSDLAERADLANEAAQAALAGKKQLLDQLQEDLTETTGVMEEIQRAIDSTLKFRNKVCRIREIVRQRLVNLQRPFKEDIIQPYVDSARLEVGEKRSLLDAVERRLKELHTCMKEAEENLEQIWGVAKEANNSATEAKARIDTMRKLVSKIKKLKRMEDSSKTFPVLAPK